MATHSSILAWRIPGTEEPSGLPSVGLHRVGHDWSNLAAAAAAYILQLKFTVLFYTSNLVGFPGSSISEESDCNEGDLGSIPGSERSPGEGNGNQVFLPGESHGQRSLAGCSPWGRKESGRTERLHFHFSLSCIGEGNGNPLQCSSLGNPRNGGA